MSCYRPGAVLKHGWSFGMLPTIQFIFSRLSGRRMSRSNKFLAIQTRDMMPQYVPLCQENMCFFCWDAHRCHEFKESSHVMAKNLQSIRRDNKLQDFIAELDNCDFDMLLVSETRCDKRQDVIVTAAGHKVFLSGGSCCRNGVRICVSQRFLDQISGLILSSCACLNIKMSHWGCYLSIVIMEGEFQLLDKISMQ